MIHYILQAQRAILEIPEILSPYKPVAKPCGLVSDLTGGSDPMPYASPITSIGVLSLLIILSL